MLPWAMLGIGGMALGFVSMSEDDWEANRRCAGNFTEGCSPTKPLIGLLIGSLAWVFVMILVLSLNEGGEPDA